MAHRLIFVALMVSVMASGCFEGRTVDVADPEQLARTGVNMTGLGSWTEADWTELATKACSGGAWDHDVARDLGETELRAAVEADVEVPFSTDELAAVVWQLALQACRDRFPDEAIELGPPGLR